MPKLAFTYAGVQRRHRELLRSGRCGVRRAHARCRAAQAANPDRVIQAGVRRTKKRLIPMFLGVNSPGSATSWCTITLPSVRNVSCQSSAAISRPERKTGRHPGCPEAGRPFMMLWQVRLPSASSAWTTLPHDRLSRCCLRRAIRTLGYRGHSTPSLSKQRAWCALPSDAGGCLTRRQLCPQYPAHPGWRTGPRLTEDAGGHEGLDGCQRRGPPWLERVGCPGRRQRDYEERRSCYAACAVSVRWQLESRCARAARKRS